MDAWPNDDGKEGAGGSTVYSNFVFIITDGVNVVQEMTLADYPSALTGRPKPPNATVGIFTVGDILSMDGGAQAKRELLEIVASLGTTSTGAPRGSYASINDMAAIFQRISNIILAGATKDEAF